MMLVVTIVSLIAAAVMGALAWRLAQAERRRSDARVAALVASLEADPRADAEPRDDLQFRPQSNPFDDDEPTLIRPRSEVLAEFPGEPSESVETRSLFDVTERDEPGGLRRLAPAAIVAGVLVGGSLGAWMVSHALRPAAAPTRPAAAVQPLELLSLTSTRRDTELSIAGLVRNPTAGARLERVAAVVFFFDDHGGFLTSARAPLAFPTLSPGEQCPFQVTVTAPEGVSRYRVSFRIEEGGVVSHVDRRPMRSDGPGASDAPPARRAGL